jgi:hypothetical protein
LGRDILNIALRNNSVHLEYALNEERIAQKGETLNEAPL